MRSTPEGLGVDALLDGGTTYRILDLDFGLRVDDRDLGGRIAPLLHPFRSAGGTRSWYHIVSDRTTGSHRVLLDGAEILNMSDEHFLGLFMWHLNQRVMLDTRSHLMVHAAVASLEGAAVVLPGDPDAGKSTLVAGLVAAGFDYLSDEAAAVDLDSGLVCPYPRAIALERGSWPLLPDLAPPSTAVPQGDLWLLTPEQIRGGSIGAPARSRMVVFPRLRPGTPARLVPLGRAQALRMLARRSTNLAALSEPGFHAAVALVVDATCWVLELDGLEAAVPMIRDVLTERVGSG